MLRISKAAIAALLAFVVLPVPAIQPYEPSQADPASDAAYRVPSHQVHDSALDVTPSLGLDAARDAQLQSRLATFSQRYGRDWEVRWDARGDRPNLIQGSGVALIPGRGNTLTPAAFGVADAAALDRDRVAAEGLRFVGEVADLLGTYGLDLRLDEERSVAFGDGNPRWFLEYAQYHQGVRVDGAFVFVRIAHGNVVQFGAERIADVAIDARPSLTRDAAFAAAWSALGFPAGTRLAETVEAGALAIYPTRPDGESPGEAYAGVRGGGYRHVLAWRHVFRVEGNPSTWQVLTDAHSGRLIDVRDLNVYADATVSGGVYATTNTDPELVVPFPFTAVTNNGSKITDTDGVYDYSGGTASSTLNGRYFRMSDSCGSISLSNNSTGNLAFGSGSGTDCATPGTGGAGNTHASRSGFYHLTRINEKARAILPGNSWLQSTVTANMNLNQTCNAYWSGGTLNFFKSGGGCSNTGEIAAVFLHEWGHGLDSNTGGAANEYGSGEAVGDTFAFLETRDSCIGPNFRPGGLCHNCTSCTGVRDVGDFSLLGTRTLATPANVTASSGINCGAYIGLTGVACPYVASNGSAYRGPMGYEGHCESYIASSANWDLTHLLVDAHGEEAGWQQMDQIWYASLTPSKSAYQVQSGGQCNPSATVNGCGATNWYTVFVAADDDDGNLANGTPNACRIWDAFNAHGIACGTRPACSAGAADFSLGVTPSSQAVCAGSATSYTIQIGAQGGFSNPVSLSASGLPSAASASFSPNPAAPGASSTLTLTTGASTPAGSHTITIAGSASGSGGHSAQATLTVSTALTAAPTLLTPANGATAVASPVALSWTAVPGATAYTVEIASDAGFTAIVTSAPGVAGTSYAAQGLNPATTYYWRVRATNGCGNGPLSSVSSFGTASLVCAEPALAIPDNNTTGINSTISVSDPSLLDGMRLHVSSTHTYPGDLKFTLSRNGTQVLAIDRPGVPATTFGCGTPAIDVVLDDAAANPVENACATSAPGIGGTLRPNNPLDSAFTGQAFAGTWTLNVSDNASGDTGTLTRWCLEPKIAAPATHTVGGTVSGLAGSGLTLRLNGGTPLAIGGNGSFTFPTPLASGASYAVAVEAQPSGPSQTCTVSGGSGTVGSGDVTSVAVVCTTRTFTVGGTVSGLAGDGLTLRLNGGAPLAIGGNGAFTFPTPVASGAAYAVTVGTQPSEPSQTCTVSAGSGTVGDGAVTNVAVACTTRTFTVGGTVSGLTGSGLTLRLNGGAPLAIGGNGAFTFPTPVASGAAYAVTVGMQPSDPSQTCTVSAGSGTVGDGAVTNIAVTCTIRTYSVGGTVSGLLGQGLTLRLNGGAPLAIGGDGAFTFPTVVASGGSYTVTVGTQPTVPAQTCTVTGGSGTVNATDVTDVTVVCRNDVTDRLFADDFEADGD
ncbi:MAG TPA: proprotein convertase P-domain-containing protein [Dokdonella sp.]|uniref:fibronectin type III domain-containing protein n=1 Tax=Dokdonella sp. TaxID=2291710 RepID=UPI002BD3C8CB|nr:proprotein convertase P-domain-containing protein [Dokdonella sp.]HUD42463.1 proprotein convertase P-domain-containing protein [Dokdonella sp.]